MGRGGLLSLAGALANAELGAMYPHAGGDYVYLREAFSEFAGFLMGWVSFFAIFTGTVATLAAGFAEALDPMLDLGEGGGRHQPDNPGNQRQFQPAHG